MTTTSGFRRDAVETLGALLVDALANLLFFHSLSILGDQQTNNDGDPSKYEGEQDSGARTVSLVIQDVRAYERWNQRPE